MKALFKLLRGTLALCVLASLVVGIPVGLATFVGWPLPASWPSVSEVGSFLTTNGVSDTVLIDALAIALWMLWIAFVSAVVAESVAAASGRVARRVIGGPVQLLASALVGAIVLSLPTGFKVEPPTAPLLASIVQPIPSMQLAVATEAAPVVPIASVAQPAAEMPEYVVVRHDTLWGIAEQYLGDPQRWHEIFNLNQGVTQPDGRSLVDGDRIYPGWRLTLPADATIAKAPVEIAPVSIEASLSTPEIVPEAPTAVEPEPTQAAVSAQAPESAPVAVTDHSKAHGETSAESSEGEGFLAGLAVGAGLSLAVGGALAKVRRRRRRCYEPSDVGAGLADFDRSNLRDVGRLVDAEGESARSVPGEVAVEIGNTERVVDLSRIGMTELAGRDALATARHMLVEFVASHDADAASAIVIGTALASGLGVESTFAGLDVVENAKTALASVQTEVLRRRRLMDERDVESITELRAAIPEEPLPAILIVVSVESALGVNVDWDSSALGIGMLTIEFDDSRGDTPGETDKSVPHLERSDAGAALKLLSDVRAVDDVAVEYPAPQSVPFEAPVADVEPSEQLVRLTLLGDERVSFGDSEVTSGLRRRGRELLAYLALHPNGVTKDRAVDAMWAGRQPSGVSAEFRAAVTSVRQVLRTLTGASDEQFVVLANDRYRLDPKLISCDVWDFQTALARASAAGESDREELLEAAASSYGGEFADGATYLWVEEVRQDLQRRMLDVLVKLSELAANVSDQDRASSLLERAVGIEPVAESLYVRLMKLYGDRADRHSIEQTMHRLEEALDTIGLEPRSETKAEYRRLRSG